MAIVKLIDTSGWNGSGRVRAWAALKAAGYVSLAFVCERGGVHVFVADSTFIAVDLVLREASTVQPESCTDRNTPPLARRRANALNVEIGAPVPRCVRQEPIEWPNKGLGPRWLASGGDASVFGPCSAARCPKILAQVEGQETR